ILFPRVAIFCNLSGNQNAHKSLETSTRFGAMIQENSARPVQGVCRYRSMNSLVRYLDRQSETQATVLSLLLFLAVGFFDYVTGFEISFSIFYLLPIGLVSWFAVWRKGVLM